MSQTLHEPLSNLIAGGIELIGEGHADLALWLYTETELLARLTLGADHPLRAQALLGMGVAFDLNGELDVAQRLCGTALELLPPDHPVYGPALFSLASVQEHAGEWENAYDLYRKALGYLSGRETLYTAALQALLRLDALWRTEEGLQAETEMEVDEGEPAAPLPAPEHLH